MFGTENRRAERQRRAVQRRQEQLAAGLQQRRAGADRAARIGNVFEHLHAGDDVEMARHFAGQRFDADLAVVDHEPAFVEMKPRDIEHGRREIDRGHARSGAGERFAEQAAAASDIERVRAFQRRALGNVGEAHRIEIVQRTRFAVRVPPARGKTVEFRGFGWIDVDFRIHSFTVPSNSCKACHSRSAWIS